MKNYRKHIDDFFREKLGRYKETPPPDVWDDLEVRLDGLASQAPNSYRWLKHVGVISLIAVLSISLFRNFSGSSSADNTLSNEASIATNPVTSASTTATDAEGTKSLPEPSATPAADASQPDLIAANEKTGPEGTNQLSGNTPPTKTKKHYAKIIAKNYPSKRQQKPASMLFSSPEQQENYVGEKFYRPGPGVEIEEINPMNAIDLNTILANRNIKLEWPSKPFNNNKYIHKAEKHHRLEAGIKGGYEQAFKNSVASKYIIAPYLQYNVSSRISVMVQPSVKFSSSNTRIQNSKSYIQVSDTGTVDQVGESIKRYGSVIFGIPRDPYYTTKYNYKQKHDSIIKSDVATYLDLELPILLKYKISPALSVYGGANICYNKLTSISEHEDKHTDIQVSIDHTNVTPDAPGHLAIKDVIKYGELTPISEYKKPDYSKVTGDLVNLGYMVGVSYELGQRWMADALLQQTPKKMYNQGTTNSSSSLTAPYVRLSIGYKLIR